MYLYINEKKISIIPRSKDDGINFLWEPLSHTDDFLEQLRGKLMNKMSEVLQEGGEIQKTQENVGKCKKM